MHKSMSKDVIKRLVVSIKSMQNDLNFYENNWNLFKSPNLDYVPEFDNKMADMSPSNKTKYKTMRPASLIESKSHFTDSISRFSKRPPQHPIRSQQGYD